jgi:hypothetical protein
MTDPIRLRASSISDLLDCPLRWYKRTIEGLKLPNSPPALVGTAVHESTAVFDQAAIDGEKMSIDDAAGAAVDILTNPTEEVDWTGTNTKKAVEKAVGVHTAYCLQIAPTQHYVAVEMTLEPLVIEMGSGVKFSITGTLDRIREVNGMRGVADVKTGARAVSRDGEVVVGKHLPQLGAYELLAEYNFGAMNLDAAIIGLHTGSIGRVGIGDIKGAKSALVGDQDSPGILHYVEPYFKSGLFPPNPGSWLCTKRFCPHFHNCKFHG